MDLSRLQTLREKLATAREFGDVWRYFLDHFGEDQAFLDFGEPVRDPFLEGIIAQIGRQMFGEEVTLTDWVLRRVPGHGFIHGSGDLHGRLAGVLYFEADRAGLLAVIMLNPPETKYARFGARILPNLSAAPSPN